MIEMVNAWEKGISTHEFRKCLTSDLRFIMDFKKIKNHIQQQKEHQHKIDEAMRVLQNG